MRIPSPSGHPSFPARRRLVAAALAATVLLTGCGGGEEAAEAAAPDLVANQPIDVTGRAGLVLHDLSTSGTLVFPEGSEGDERVPAEEAAIQAAADEVRTWLDRVLSERNRGLTTTVAASGVDATAFARAIGADGPATDGVLDVQVASATYLIEVAYLGLPGWALARVESLLVPADDPTNELGRRLDTFVFTVDESGAVDFIALEVAP